MQPIHVLAPMPTQFGWRTNYFAGCLAAFGYLPDHAAAAELLHSQYGLLDYQNLPPTDDFRNRVCILNFPGWQFIGVEGTSRLAQWGSYVTNFGLKFDDANEVGVPNYFHLCALDVAEKLRLHASRHVPTVLCGHSLGGATASVVSTYVNLADIDVKSVWTYGSPRPGNVTFRDRYRLPNFRTFAGNDPVPKLPPEGYYASLPFYSSQQCLEMAHVGEGIEVGRLDITEAALETAAEAGREVAVYRNPLTEAHFMGSYLEAIYEKMSPDDRGVAAPLVDFMISIQRQGQPNFPFEVASVPEYRANVVQSDADEAATLTSTLGDPGRIRVELFTTASDLGVTPKVDDFVAAAFPGYSPFDVPAPDAIAKNERGITTTTPFTIRFTATADSDQTHAVAGAFATIRTPGGDRVLLGYRRFGSPVKLSHRNDYQDVQASFAVIRVA